MSHSKPKIWKPQTLNATQGSKQPVQEKVKWWFVLPVCAMKKNVHFLH